MITLRLRLVLISLCVLLAPWAVADVPRQLMWADLIPKQSTSENPFAKLTKEQLSQLGEIATTRERKARVDHDANAFDRQTRFGDRRRQHDLPPALRIGLDGAILRVIRHRAIQWKYRRVVERTIDEQAFDASDLSRAGKEYENVASVTASGVNDGRGNCSFERQR